MARVTMADVARAAAVNKGTVSRALRGDRRISPETRERVWEAAKNLGYELDAVASGLSSKRTGVIGVVFERLETSWSGEFLSAAAGVLARCKTELLLLEAGGSPINVVRRVEGRKLDGLIWIGDRPLDHGALDIPVVRVSRAEYPDEFRVGLDHEAALTRVRRLADGRPVVYRGGLDALMGFLSELKITAGDGEPFLIWDGLRVLPADERPSLVCGDERLARLLGVDCLRVPVRQLGVLATRVLTNVLRDSGVRPRVTLAKTPLVSASGELILE